MVILACLFCLSLSLSPPFVPQLLSEGTWEYKPPSAFDIPLDFKVTLMPNLPNPDGVLRSKATGEPPYIIANSGEVKTQFNHRPYTAMHVLTRRDDVGWWVMVPVYFAVKDAIYEARKEVGLEESFLLPIPAVVSTRLEAVGVEPSQFIL